MNQRQKRSMVKFLWNLATICLAVAVIGNMVRSDIPVAKTIILVVMAGAFAALGWLVNKAKPQGGHHG